MKLLCLSFVLSMFGVFAITSGQARAQSSQTIKQVTLPAIEGLEKTKANRSDAEQKISSSVLQAIEKMKSGAPGSPSTNGVVPASTTDGIVVDIRAKVSEDLLDDIIQKHGKVISQFPEYDAIRAEVPAEQLKALASRPDVDAVTAALKPSTNQLAPDIEGDIGHAANLARTKFGVQGEGVKVGVISDSIDDGNGVLAAAYDTGALTPVTILPSQAGEGAGEGLAMLEVVHAIAPKADLYFATGGGGLPQMAANIRALRDQGCKVIIDDITYPEESPFQDNDIGSAIDDVSASGVLYFSSAANSGNVSEHNSSTWEGDFADGGLAGSKYAVSGTGALIGVFSGRITLNTIDKLTGTGRVNLFWSDPLHHATNEYDLFVVEPGGTVRGYSNTSEKSGTLNPFQSVPGAQIGDSIVIVKAADAQSRFLHVSVSGSGAYIRYNTGGSVTGHNASGADNAFTVAAAKAPSPPSVFDGSGAEIVENFSADGPRRIFFKADGTPWTPGDFSSSGGKLLQKPDITAADSVTTTLSHYSNLNPFKGTSAAAPQVGAIAALLISCSPASTPAQIRAVLEQTAIPIAGPSPNPTAGFGIVMANSAAAKLCHLPTSASNAADQVGSR